MHRRDFLQRSAAGALAAWLARPSLFAQAAPAAAPAAPAAPAVSFTPLRGDVGYFTGRGGTIGWLVNAAGIAVVDTQFAETAARFAEGLPGRDGRPLDLVINTHHHGDHTGGNATLRPQAKRFVAQANVPELLRARAQADGRTLDPAVLPDETFRDTWSTTLGGETVSARYHGPAHTRGDIVVTFERAGVVHMGDLMFNRIYPVIDRPGGASIRGWISVLERVHASASDDTLFIFGHAGPKGRVTGGRGELLTFRDYLTGLLSYVERGLAEGRTKEQIVALENLPGFDDFHQPLPNRLGQNLGVAYDELTTRAG